MQSRMSKDTAGVDLRYLVGESAEADLVDQRSKSNCHVEFPQ
jgi:hypothetical protein